MKIGIFGLGLIGGSFALATSRRTDHEVFGFDIDEASMVKAKADGAICDALTTENLPDMDLVLLGVVPHLAVEFVQRNAALFKGYVMDLCGVKRVVSQGILPLAKTNGFSYIGGHPMAGSEFGGYDSAASTMFDHNSMLLIPHGPIPDWILQYLTSLGFSEPVITNDENHDRIIAFSSQMAHVVSNNFCKSKTGPEHRGFSADSLRDLTRVASLNPIMWSELFIANKDNLLAEVDRLIRDIEIMADAIRREDKDQLALLLAEGSSAKKRLYPRGVTCEELKS
ncbi:MAG: prephenate dehydrogenase [Clostridiaceae bacterium]